MDDEWIFLELKKNLLYFLTPKFILLLSFHNMDSGLIVFDTFRG